MTGWYVTAALVLLVANGFFVAAEFALIAARSTAIEQRAATGDLRSRWAFASAKELSFMLAGAQLGITMTSLGLGFVAEPSVGHLLESALGNADLPSGLTHSISLVLGLTIVVFLHMVVGEMAPKNIAISAPEKTALWVAIPFRIYANVFRAFIRMLNEISSAALRAFGVEPKEEIQSARSAQEIGWLISESAAGGLLDKLEYRLLSGAVGFAERDAASVMVPRTDITAIPVTITAADIERIVLESGHSRLPVYTSDLDDIIGFFHAKDLLRIPIEERDRPLSRRFIRRMLVVPESRKLHPLLLDMRRQRMHMALVVDEHGGISGIVTIEDLLEELVGEIRDEYDVGELGVQRLGEDRFIVPGTLRIDEARDRLGVDLPDGDYETIAGFVMDRLGRIPKRRDHIDYDNWRLRVVSMRRRRVLQVAIEPAPRGAPAATT